MSLRLQPVRVGTESADEEGRLVFVDDAPVAVLVRLADDHDEDGGKWFLEAGFGGECLVRTVLFGDLDQARAWFVRR